MHLIPADRAAAVAALLFALAAARWPARKGAAMTWGRGSTRQSRRERAVVLTVWPTCYLRYPGCTVVSTEDDHVVPVSRGGSNHLSNRRGACHSCHRIKSQREAAAGRARASRRRPAERHPGQL